jgi:hypothetical protein
MTELERAVADALRLSTAAATSLLPTIQRNISAGQMELIRSGVSEETVLAGGALVEDCIISFCLVRMGDEDGRAWYEEAFRTQEDNLRKSESANNEE